MAVKRAIVHSWGSPAVLDQDNNLNLWWACSSSRPIVRVLLGGTDGSLAKAAEIGLKYAQNVQSRINGANNATAAGAVGKRGDEYSVHIHNWGSRPEMRGLTHPLDAIQSWRDAYPAIGNNSGPYIENGIAECKAWSDIFLESFRDNLNIMGLPHPSRFHLDIEITMDGSFRAAVSSSSGEGWMNFAYNDPRATTEFIDGISTFKELVDSWNPLDGLPFSWNATQSYWSGTNRNLREFLGHLNLIIRDHLLHEAIIIKAKELFPNMTWGNYEHGRIGNRENPTLGRGKATNRWYEDTGPYSEWISPVLYPLKNTSFQDSGSQKSNWLNIYNYLGIETNGPPYGDGYSLLWTENTNITIQNCINSSSSPSLVAPWLPFAGYDNDGHINNFRDGVDLVIINSSDSSKFAVGNQIVLLNSSDTVLYTANIVRIVNLENGSHQINIKNISPTNKADFVNVTKARDTTIVQDANVNSVTAEPSFNYAVRQEDMYKVIDKCVELNITEYLFWQNAMTPELWNLQGECIKRIEEGLGVRLGEACIPRVESLGEFVSFKFIPPANGPWILSNLEIDVSKNPVVSEGVIPISYNQVTSENLSIDNNGNLIVRLAVTSEPITFDAEVNVTIYEGWISDDVPGFKTSATDNVKSGFGANSLTGEFIAINESLINNKDLPESPPEIPGPFASGPSISPARLKRMSPFFSINNQTFQTRQTMGMISPVDTLMFNSSATVVLRNSFGSVLDSENLEIRYTINGGIPTKKSLLYTNPIVLNRNISNGQEVTLQAKIFDKNSIRSGKLLKMDIIID